MIKINLLPKSLRRKEEVIGDIPVYPIITIAILIILAFHIFFGVFILYKKVQSVTLTKKLVKMRREFRDVDILKKNLMEKEDKVKIMEYVLGRNLYWTDFLNRINSAVPKRLWLNRLSFTSKGLVIEGSVFSFGKDEISIVNRFFDDLKNEDVFVRSFSLFNLDSMQRRSVKNYEILDFLLSAKEKEEVEVGTKDRAKAKR